jgi:hypothetical protein
MLTPISTKPNQSASHNFRAVTGTAEKFRQSFRQNPGEPPTQDSTANDLLDGLGLVLPHPIIDIYNDRFYRHCDPSNAPNFLST